MNTFSSHNLPPFSVEEIREDERYQNLTSEKALKQLENARA